MASRMSDEYEDAMRYWTKQAKIKPIPIKPTVVVKPKNNSSPGLKGFKPVTGGVEKRYTFGGAPPSTASTPEKHTTKMAAPKGASKREYAGMYEYTGPYRYKDSDKDKIDMVPEYQMRDMKVFKGSKSSTTEWLRKKNAVTDTHEDFKGPWGSGTEER